MSTKAGSAPRRATTPAVAKNVYGVVTTISPRPTPSAMRTASSASVPDAIPTARLVPTYAAMRSSNSTTCGPMM
jgi:hypothetical protein